MNKFLQTLTSHTAPVLVDASLNDEGGFSIAVGLLGRRFTTSPELTRKILNSPGFDQLFKEEKAVRILEVMFEQAQH